jgi:hypothetical protein
VTIGSVSFQKGDRVFLDIANANMNEKVFTSPRAIDPGRTKDRYIGGDVLSKYDTSLQAAFRLTLDTLPLATSFRLKSSLKSFVLYLPSTIRAVHRANLEH